jgi:hypothetical protein
LVSVSFRLNPKLLYFGFGLSSGFGWSLISMQIWIKRAW